MLNLVNATVDKLRLVTSAAATIDVHASWADLNGTTVTPGRTNTAITTATTTDIVATPAASTIRNVKTLHIRNKHASLATDVTVTYDANATVFELYKVNLAAGEMLEYVEGIGFFKVANLTKLDWCVATLADRINATTSFADITDLSCPVGAGKTYAIRAGIIHANDATTTGSRFGFGGVAMTYMIAATIDTVTPSVTASAHSAGAVTAVDTAITAQTTGNTANRLAVIAGTIVPSATGTLALRFASEVAVAAGLTVRRGSWLWVREVNNT